MSMVMHFILLGMLRGIYLTSHPIGGSTMNSRKFVIVATAALVALSLSVTAFAATKNQSGTRTQIKSGTCVK
jgi:uncharacterized protein (UPF0212 family)